MCITSSSQHRNYTLRAFVFEQHFKSDSCGARRVQPGESKLASNRATCYSTPFLCSLRMIPTSNIYEQHKPAIQYSHILCTAGDTETMADEWLLADQMDGGRLVRE
jgi:hypothetical protein